MYFSQHTPQEHVHLHHFLLNPIFAPHVKHILEVRHLREREGEERERGYMHVFNFVHVHLNSIYFRSV